MRHLLAVSLIAIILTFCAAVEGGCTTKRYSCKNINNRCDSGRIYNYCNNNNNNCTISLRKCDGYSIRKSDICKGKCVDYVVACRKSNKIIIYSNSNRCYDSNESDDSSYSRESYEYNNYNNNNNGYAVGKPWKFWKPISFVKPVAYTNYNSNYNYGGGYDSSGSYEDSREDRRDRRRRRRRRRRYSDEDSNDDSDDDSNDVSTIELK